MERSISPWTVRGLYLIAAILAAAPVLEVVLTTWPMRPTDLLWRYGALGLAAGQIPNLAIGMAALLGVAYWQDDGLVVRALAVGCVIIALLVVPAMGMFALDLSSVRALREAELRGPLLASGLIQEARYLVSGTALAFLGIGALATRSGGHRTVPSPAVLRGG